MDFLHNFKNLINDIKDQSNLAKLIVVTKNQSFDKINHLINEGHKDFGENKVQEAKSKWEVFLNKNDDINLHFIGKLQSNKAKDAFVLFDFIHTLDSEKLAKKFSDLEKSTKKNLKYFIQVNIGNEAQKNGIDESLLANFIIFCKKDLNLNIIGLMCIPPVNLDPLPFFKKMHKLKVDNNLAELSMGMSSDYKEALDCGSTYLRIGSAIFK
jgi:pyridoxal phosphate enzyme (YggS family)